MSFRADRQQLDLSRLHYECERNFRRLSKIPLDTLELGTTLQVRFKGLTTCAVKFEVIEVTGIPVLLPSLPMAEVSIGCQISV